MANTETTTVYSVARDGVPVTGYREKLTDAQQDLASVLATAKSIGIVDTAILVEVDITTTETDPVPYVAPDPTPEVTPTDASTDSAPTDPSTPVTPDAGDTAPSSAPTTDADPSTDTSK
jgi:hypothetical protein